jgi:hypothetical protein
MAGCPPPVSHPPTLAPCWSLPADTAVVFGHSHRHPIVVGSRCLQAIMGGLPSSFPPHLSAHPRLRHPGDAQGQLQKVGHEPAVPEAPRRDAGGGALRAATAKRDVPAARGGGSFRCGARSGAVLVSASREVGRGRLSAASRAGGGGGSGGGPGRQAITSRGGRDKTVWGSHGGACITECHGKTPGRVCGAGSDLAIGRVDGCSRHRGRAAAYCIATPRVPRPPLPPTGGCLLYCDSRSPPPLPPTLCPHSSTWEPKTQ